MFFFANLFRASQIAQIKFSSQKNASMVGSVALHQQLEDRMRSRRVNIAPRLSGYSVTFSSSEQEETVVCVGYNVLALAFNEYSVVLVLPDHERNLAVFVLE